MNPNETSVTGVLVTGKTPERYPLAKKAIEAWQRQKYPGKRRLLVINDHPAESIYPMSSEPEGVTEARIGAPGGRRMTLGELRNIGINLADTDYIVSGTTMTTRTRTGWCTRS